MGTIVSTFGYLLYILLQIRPPTYTILLGLAAFIRGKREEKSYYNSISTRPDVREFLEHKPEHPEPGALKIGGCVAMAIGLLMLVMGGGFWLWG